MEPTLVRDLEQFITAPPPDEHSFNALALRLFEHQYIANLPFQRVCRQRGRTPVTVGHWRDIPAVPIHAFKEFTLSATDPAMCQRVFKTSGTTQGAVRGQHFHPHLEIYDLSMRVNFQRHIMRQHSKMRIMVLFPDEKLMPHSSLAHYLELAIRYFGSPDSRHYIDAHGLCLDSWYSDLLQACQHQQPVLLLGASYSLLHACDALAARDQSVRLPPGSCIMDTGGFKGQSRELGADEFYATLQARLGVEPAACQNMYGMTELSSQFYDRGQGTRPAIKYGPHWARTRILDPYSGLELPSGQVGIIAHTDLGNFNSALCIQTEDLGYQTQDGFVLLGRAQGTSAKGCSLAVAEFLSAAQP